MNAAARTTTGRGPAHFGPSPEDLPLAERRRYRAPRPGGAGTPRSVLAVVPADVATTLEILGHLRQVPELDGPRAAPPRAGLVLDRESREVWADGKRIELTYREFELLGFFMTHPRQVFSRSELLSQVWYREEEQATRTVDVHIHRLRCKLGSHYGRCVITVHRAGYKFSPRLA